MKSTIPAILAALLLGPFSRAEDVLYTARSVIEFKSDAADPEKILTANLPRGDSSISLKQDPASKLVDIVVSGPDAKTAATRANQVALSLQSLLNDPAAAAPVVTIVLNAAAADATRVENPGAEFTPWMDKSQMDAFMTELDGAKPGGKNFWDRGHWILAVEGRWQDGKPEHRIRYGAIPKGKRGILWYWWMNCNQEEWDGHVERYADAGLTLTHWTSYTRPDGRKIYDGVWHKVVD